MLGTLSSPLRVGASRLSEYYGIFNYYADGPRSTVGVWGPLAERWGLSELTVEQFAQVVEGKALDGSGRGVQTQNGTHTSVIDVSYVSPKSVGELLLRADERLRAQVVEAFRESVVEAHEMVHEEAEVCRVSVKRPSVVGEGMRQWTTQGRGCQDPGVADSSGAGRAAESFAGGAVFGPAHRGKRCTGGP